MKTVFIVMGWQTGEEEFISGVFGMNILRRYMLNGWSMRMNTTTSTRFMSGK